MLPAIKVTARKCQGKAAGSTEVMVSSKHSPLQVLGHRCISPARRVGACLSLHICLVAGMLQGDLEGGSGWEGDALFWGKVSPRLSRNLGTIPKFPQGFSSWQKINVGHFQDPRHVCPREERWMVRARVFPS